MRPRPPRAGFLLIEAMIAAVVLSVAAVGITMLLVTSDAQASIARDNATAVALAKQLIEEVAAKPLYVAAGTTAGSTPPACRAAYATVAGYADYTDTTAAMRSANGASVTPGYDGAVFTRRVTVVYGTGPTGSTAPVTDFARVTVTVTGPTGRTVSLTRMVARTDWSL